MRSYVILMLFFGGFLWAENKLPVTETADTVKTSQASTTGWLGTKTCIVVNATRERLCDSRAQKWCDEHLGAKECRRFENRSVKAP